MSKWLALIVAMKSLLGFYIAELGSLFGKTLWFMETKPNLFPLPSETDVFFAITSPIFCF